jgi:cobalt-zinc-cadmium efflux system outer membrane protein
MRVLWRFACIAYVVVVVAQAMGCRSGLTRSTPASSLSSLAAQNAGVDETPKAQTESSAQTDVQPVTFEAPTAEEVPVPSVVNGGLPVLEVEPLVVEVLARNPDIRSAVAAWRAAAAQYTQEISLDDPMFGYMLGPGSWGSPEVDSAYMLEASQRVPWPGKRQLRGDISQAEANAAFHDVGEERLRIAEAARLAYYDYFLAHRQLAVLEESQALLESFREIAQSKYEAADVEQQDVLLADVELAELETRRLELSRQARVARARINTLLLVPPDAPLPLPPSTLSTLDEIASVEELRARALAQRPELAAQAGRIRAERYSVALACKEFYPDMEFVSRYDAFWQEEPLRPMIGMNLNIPLYKQKRWAAVREARARVVKEQAAFDSKVAELVFAVEQAHQRVLESLKALEVYQARLLPTAGQSVESARASYISGALDFLRLVESQRQYLDIQETYYEAMAEYHRRKAELDRIVGVATFD